MIEPGERVAIVGDAGFHEACAVALAAALPRVSLQWAALGVSDLAAGAVRLDALELDGCDAVIVGSALIEIVEASVANKRSPTDALAGFVADLRRAIDGVRVHEAARA